MIDNEMTAGFYKPTEEDREKYKGMSIAILMPCNDYNTPIRQEASTVKMVSYSWYHGLPIYTLAFTERTVVDWARNILAKTFLEATCEYTGEPYTHALWVDDDQVFNPDMACRLASLGHLDMVSAVYYGRSGGYWPTVYLKDDQENAYTHWPMTDCPPVVFEADAVGFGSLLMRREVLEGVPKPWFTIDARAGEDIAFCKHAKDHGYKVWVAGDYKIGHISGRPRLITQDDFEQYRTAHPEEFKNRVRVHLPVIE